jgi:hypothetical protein
LALEDSLPEFCHLSINAISGIDEGDALKIIAFVHNQVMLTLINSSSSHNIISSKFQKVGIVPIPRTPNVDHQFP